MDQPSGFRTRTKVIFAAVALLIVVFGVVSNKHFGPKVHPADTASVPDPTVHITATGFDPPLVTVKQGHKVMWINDDPASHSVVANTSTTPATGAVDLPNSPLLTSGQSYTYSFTQTKSITYHDSANAAHGGIVLIQP